MVKEINRDPVSNTSESWTDQAEFLRSNMQADVVGSILQVSLSLLERSTKAGNSPFGKT